MSVRFVQASESQHLAAEARSRRRSLPPSLSVSVSQSVNQRWRERPRCPASPVAPGRRDGVVHAIVGRAARCCLRAQVVQDGRAARVHDFVSRFAGTMRPTNRTAISSRARHVFPDGTSGSCIQILPSHDRAFHAGAVLSVVNALRFASTRPAAGPSGIDDACARHDLGYCAMAGFLMARAKVKLTPDFRWRILMYRVCAPTGTFSASHPVHAERVSSRRPQGTIQAHPHNIASGCYAVAAREPAHLTRDHANSHRRVVSKTNRR